MIKPSLFKKEFLKYFAFSLVFIGCAANCFAQCDVPPIIALDDRFQEDHKVIFTEDFSLDIYPNGKDVQSVEVLVNGKRAVFKDVDALVSSDHKLVLESTIGPEFSKAEIEIPLHRNYVEVNVDAGTDCVASSSHTFVGFDSGVHAIIVGVNNYRTIAESLDFAENDARKFLDVLQEGVDKTGRSLSYEILIDGEATKSKIMQAIDRASLAVSAEATLIVYFSGHGMVQARGPRLDAFLVPWDGDKNLAASTMLSHRRTLEMVQDSYAKNKIFIFDSCFSGRGAFETPVSDPNYRDKFLELDRATELALSSSTNFLSIPETVLWFSSSSKGQVSYEMDDMQHGLFTKYLLDSINDQDWVSDKNIIRYADIKDYIVDKIARDHDGIQRPNIVGDHDVVAAELWTPGN